MKKLLLPTFVVVMLVWNSAAFALPFKLYPLKLSAEYNSQDNPGRLVPDSKGTMIYQDFVVDIAGLNSDFIVHFDLYAKKSYSSINKIEPLSHDAQSAPVPEPASMFLLGAGLLTLLGLNHRSKQKK